MKVLDSSNCMVRPNYFEYILGSDLEAIHFSQIPLIQKAYDYERYFKECLENHEKKFPGLYSSFLDSYTSCLYDISYYPFSYQSPLMRSNILIKAAYQFFRKAQQRGFWLFDDLGSMLAIYEEASISRLDHYNSAPQMPVNMDSTITWLTKKISFLETTISSKRGAVDIEMTRLPSLRKVEEGSIREIFFPKQLR